MKQFTVRGLPEEVEKRIMKEAADKGVSLNKAVVSLLSRGGPGGRGKRGESYRDLDPFFGIWKQAEGKDFDEQLELQREVDQDLWKKNG